MSKPSPVQRDYKHLSAEPAPAAFELSHKSWIIMTLSLVVVVGVIFAFTFNTRTPLPPKASESTHVPKPTSASAATATKNIPLALPTYNETDSGIIGKNNQRTQTITVRRGDNLAMIFSRINLSPQLLHTVLSSSKKAKRLKRLMPGQKMKFLFINNQFSSLTYEVNETSQLLIEKSGNDFVTTLIEQTPDVQIVHATGTIDSSLYLSAQNAGLSGPLIMALASIFGWDIDFALDIRKGDTFAIAYEELYVDGKKIRDGDIIAAEFINNQKTFRAVKYTDPNNNTGYYTPKGRNMQKAFLRTPVDFTRISSRFGKRRHPVLNRMRVHKGVDYAAPKGTPIWTTGDGKILFKGRKGGYGKVVIVKHNGGRQTLYAHMSSYKRGLRRGRTVKQGQVIGFVGSTGRATGPHLHYEFRINGRHRNPLKLKFASAKSVPNNFLQDFNEKTRKYTALLDVLGNSHVALNLN